MQLPAKAHYAVLAMLALADRYESREPVPARVISREQNVPAQFLTQIMQQLRASGLVVSTRGATGGFLLNSSPSDVSIANIVDAICPESNSGGCYQVESGSEGFGALVQDVWDELRQKQQDLLASISLSDLLQRSTASTPMFYI